eukprot:GHRR01008229.1.p1 GENE.GHRR01008229.1~~GHRR01008229.1.p1  ORF type:complete len:205 (+),score=54.74 GHRR01008229.1:163-777(+)
MSQSKSIRRLAVLSRQLEQQENTLLSSGGLVAQPCSATAVRSLPRFDPYVMETYLDDLRELKRQVYELFKYQPELLTGPELSKEEHRALVRTQLRALLDQGINPLLFFDRDYKKYFYLAECLSLVDLSLTVKSGVQYSLWGGSVLNLGTEAHRRAYFDDIGSFKLPGCFAMTELKHGSNVSSKPSDLLAAVLVAMHARVLFGPL